MSAAPHSSKPPVRLLLDVNVWIALLDDAHVHNAQALALLQTPGLHIATCPLVENGVPRMLNMPAYSNRGPVGFEPVRHALRLACTDVNHCFRPDDLSLIHDDAADWLRVYGHHQMTDLYLLALAVRHGGALATFDHRVALSAVRGAHAQHLRLL